MDISTGSDELSVSEDESDVSEVETEQRSKTPIAKKRKKTSSQEQPFMDSWLQLPQFKKRIQILTADFVNRC
jgi:hypothetical protein